MTDFEYLEQQAAAYGAYVDERARWAQVLGSTGARKSPAPKPSSGRFFLTVNLVLWFVVLPLVSYFN